MKNLITTLLFIVICTNAISQDQAVIKQPSYPEVESDLVIQIKDQGEEIQKLKEKNKILEEYIKNYFQRQDSIINESTSHFDSWLTYAAILISFLGIMATIFCAFSAWKIHLTEADVKKQFKSLSRLVSFKFIKLIKKCENLGKSYEELNKSYKDLNKSSEDLNKLLVEAEKKCRDLEARMDELKNTGIEKIIDLKKEEDIQISKIFAQYANKKRRNMEDDHEFKDEIEKYIDNLEKTNLQGGRSYNDDDFIYLGLKCYIDKNYQEVGLYWGKVNDKYDKYGYVLMLWGNALTYCAISEKRSELFKEGCEKYKSAIKLDNKDERFFSSWANALADWALNDKNPLFFNESFEKYELAAKISPASSYIYNNWGATLYDYAKSEFVEISMKPRLYKQSCEKYKLATQIDPLDYDVFSNWGLALSDWAQINNNEKLFNESYEKFKIAADINPKDGSIFDIWGGALLDQAQLNNDLISYKEDIKSILKKAEAIKEGSGSYNLACLYSLLDQKDAALIWFEKDLKYGSSQTQDEILSDSDLDNIKSDPQFNELMEKYFPKK